GVDDGTFGGNFNRLKNLVVKAGGIYLSPGFRDQSSAGLAEAKLVINEFAKVSPNAPVFVACAPNGGRICLKLLEDAGIAARLGGVFLLGSTYSTDFASSSAAKARHIPIFMGHGGSDEVIFWRSPDSFFRSLRARVPDYPVRFVTFKNGKHGTPMRMIDWRLELNRMV